MTTGTLTATANATDGTVQLSLAWSGIAFATVARVAADGTIINVRNAEPAQTDGAGAWIGFDYEAPLDLDCYYVATSTTFPGDQTLSNTVSLASGGTTVWLRHPGRPPLNIRITLAEAPTMTRAAAQGVHYVLGRSRPVATTSQRRAQAGTLLVRTDTDDDRAALEALIEDGAVLLLSTPAGWGLGNMYIAIGDVDEDRVVQYGPDTHRLWSLPFAVVDRPAGAAVASGNSWSDALGAYASWQELALAEGTWSGLLAGVG